MVPKKKSSNKAKPKQKNKHESDTDEENYEVADLSAVPTPKVEFMMPNLTPLESYKSEPKPKPKQKPKKQKAPSSAGHVLTAEQLNNEIVGMRAVINKARMSLVRHLVRKLKRLKSVVAKKPSEVLQRKMRRYEEEIHTMKSIARDDVSKFALLNKKSLNELRITGTTPVTERCLWKLACERCVVKAVEEYRTRYPDSEATTAFFLQRLGLQYSVDKEMNNLKALDSNKDEEDDDDSQEACTTSKAIVNTKRREPSDSESESEASDGGVSNKKGRFVDSDISSEEDRGIGIGTDSDDDGGEAAENRRKLLLGSPKESTKSTNKKKSLKKSKGSVLRNDTSTSLKREAGTKAVIKQVKLSEGGEIELEKPVQIETVAVVSENGHENENESPSYSFFLPASAVPDIATTSPEAAVPQKPDRVKKLKKSSGEKESGSPIKLKKKKMLPDNKISPKTKESHIPIEATAFQKHDRAKKLKKSSVGKGNGDPVKLKKKKMLPDHQINSKAKESHIPMDELHPSWAARRRAKEQQSMAPQGKRIVFSDD